MYNLRSGRGSFKGYAGECMFKLTQKDIVLPKFFSRPKYMQIFSKRLTQNQQSFLYNNWYSIDAINFDLASNQKIVIYEIKTENYENYGRPEWKRPKMTLATHNLYNEALEKGFDVKVAVVKLYDNWDYNIEISDFKDFSYCIDKPKKYD